MYRIIATGLNHKTAPVEIRERFAIPAAELPDALQMLYAQPGVLEAVILSTCNRVELYTVEEGESPPKGGSGSFFSDFFGVEESSYINHIYRYYDEKAVRHLFTVASSLDSMIVGEPQILGQVKDHFGYAQAAATTGRIFNGLFPRALNVGKRTRTETAIGELAVSVPYAAVELARKVFDSLAGKSAVLLGRGKMSENTARHLKRCGIDNIYVVHRDPACAYEFASKIGGVPLEYTDDLAFLAQADIVMCSTNAPHLLVTRKPLADIMARRKHRFMLLIDISVPRAIDPAVNDLDNVYLSNIDHLQSMVAENTRLRIEEARKAGAIIEDQLQLFMEWLNSLDVVPTIKAFRDHLELLRSEEIHRVMKNFEGFAPEQRELVEQFSRALVNKIGHMPTSRLKSAPDPEKAMHYSSVLRQLFDLEQRKQ